MTSMSKIKPQQSDYEKVLKQCKIGIKTFQNLNGALFGLIKLAEQFDSVDDHLKSSLFYYAVIRYAKPFLNSNYHNGEQIKYPIKHLKKSVGFSQELHDHLALVRNTLIAHDDFEEIQPRLLQSGSDLPEWDLFFPQNIAVANKCLSFPIELATVEQMKQHVHACCAGVHEKLMADLNKLRDLTINNRQEAIDSAEYTKNYGEIIIGNDVDNAIPDTSKDDWLRTKVPDYSKLHSGYKYEEARLGREFPLPEKVTLPNGGWVEFKVKNNSWLHLFSCD